jgi:DNA-binding protein YbaB
MEIIEYVLEIAEHKAFGNFVQIALIWIIFNMQRNATADSKMMARLMEQVERISGRNTIYEQIAQRTEQKVDAIPGTIGNQITAKTDIIESGLQSVGTHTGNMKESVNEMSRELAALQTQIRAMLTKMETGDIAVTLTDANRIAIAETVLERLPGLIEECLLDAIKKITQETPKIENEKAEKPKPIEEKSETKEEKSE